MRRTATLTISAYSRLHRHTAERAFALTWSPRFAFSITVWEWSWHFGIGSDDHPFFAGIFISHTKPSDRYGVLHAGYWSVAVSPGLWWESV